MFDQFNQDSGFYQEAGRCDCLDQEHEAFDRLPLFLPVIVVMFISYFFLLVWDDSIYGLLLGSVIPYTAFVILGTFSAQRGQRPYFFECPVVHGSMRKLSLRHSGFLVTIMVIESVAFFVKPHLPATWLAASKGSSSSSEVFAIPFVIIAMVEIWTNRSLLERAHGQAFPDSVQTKAPLG